MLRQDMPGNESVVQFWPSNAWLVQLSIS